MYPIAKSILLLFSATAFYSGMTPPKPPVEIKRVVYKGQYFEYIVRGVTRLWQCVFCTAIVLQVAVMVLLQYPNLGAQVPTLQDTICKNPSPSLSILASIHVTFVTSVLLVVAGAAIRLWCYTTLGRHFTFEIAILERHELVTSGPYSYARHLSYTGGCMVIIGTTLLFLAEDGYVAECNMSLTKIVWLVRLWYILAPYSAFSLIYRADFEDSELKKHFGERWEVYRRRVPYKFIPYVV